MPQVLQQGLPGGALGCGQVGAAQEGLQEDCGTSWRQLRQQRLRAAEKRYSVAQ
jgi:hypothetical protein